MYFTFGYYEIWRKSLNEKVSTFLMFSRRQKRQRPRTAAHLKTQTTLHGKDDALERNDHRRDGGISEDSNDDDDDDDAVGGFTHKEPDDDNFDRFSEKHEFEADEKTNASKEPHLSFDPAASSPIIAPSSSLTDATTAGKSATIPVLSSGSPDMKQLSRQKVSGA